MIIITYLFWRMMKRSIEIVHSQHSFCIKAAFSVSNQQNKMKTPYSLYKIAFTLQRSTIYYPYLKDQVQQTFVQKSIRMRALNWKSYILQHNLWKTKTKSKAYQTSMIRNISIDQLRPSNSGLSQNSSTTTKERTKDKWI